jgi:probable H4MPT-linked C1 transfer pathway protein
MQPKIVGWDIGGAHIKIAIIDEVSDGKLVIQVYQFDCPLWKGIDELTACINEVKNIINIDYYTHAITMTGELVDHFSNREQGVVAIISEMSKQLGISNVQFYAGNDRYLESTLAEVQHSKIASANWLASAHYTASKIKHAYFIDIGSTTTDIVEVRDNKVMNTGYSDEQRLIAKELVYCGVVRTPVFALCNSAQVNDKTIPVINEYFANAADVYRLTEELADYADLSDALDGRSKDKVGSAIRIARMFANDYQNEDLDIWEKVARQIRSNQVQLIKDACRHQFMNKSVPLATPIVGAGIGRFLIKDLAQQLGREYIDFEELFDQSPTDPDTINSGATHSDFRIGDCAPAVAVASLALSSTNIGK